jgi:hypothetical protein
LLLIFEYIFARFKMCAICTIIGFAERYYQFHISQFIKILCS